MLRMPWGYMLRYGIKDYDNDPLVVVDRLPLLDGKPPRVVCRCEDAEEAELIAALGSKRTNGAALSEAPDTWGERK